MSNSRQLAYKIRKHVIDMTCAGNTSHVGSALSIADIVAILYHDILALDPKNPKNSARDRFILSKGHAGTAVYAALSERGFFDEKTLKTHCQNGSLLSGHLSHKGVPGVEFSTGSLGHGLSVGAGMAYHAKLKNQTHRVFVLMSDGECDEGSNWEAILFAGHHQLSQLVAIVDYNKIQSLDFVKNTLDLEPFADKWRACHWEVIETDGHDHQQLHRAMEAKRKSSDKPLCIIAHTVKGKGVSFMENTVLWHYRSPQGEDYRIAMEEVEKKR